MLSIAEVLQMPAVRAADPLLLAGESGLRRSVRWVHTTELVDIAPLLRGGDLLLTTGIALPDDPARLVDFVRSLAGSGSVGLFVELGRRWSNVPESIVEECDRLGLPLVALRREVRFASLTQAVGERLVDEQLGALREAEQVHDTFTSLGMTEAGPEEILAAAQRLAGAPVVLEDGQHRILDYRAGPGDVTTFLDDWEHRSRRAGSDQRTFWDESFGWLVTRVGRSERDWGRLVIGASTEPTGRLITVAERAAAALAMHQLHDRQRQGRVRRLHQELLSGVLASPTDPDLARRVPLAGVPVENRTLVGLVLRPRGDIADRTSAARLDEIVAASLHSLSVHALPALVAAFETDVRLLVAAPRGEDPTALVDRLAAQIHARTPTVAAAGTPVHTLAAADRTLREALHVVAALAGRASQDEGVHRLRDVHLRGLLALLAEDDRLLDFAARELEPLAQVDRDEGTRLLTSARALVEHWGNKSAAAAALGVSRPVLYDRLHRIERLLGADLGDAEVRTSLHVALLAHPGPG